MTKANRTFPSLLAAAVALASPALVSCGGDPAHEVFEPADGQEIESVTASLAFPCPAEYICLYDTIVSSSYMEAYPEVYRYYKCSYLFNASNKTSYILNRTDAGWRVYDSTNCTGSYGYIYPRSSGGMNSTWNNKISSIMREAIP